MTLAYVCIAGENVGEEDARALSELIGDTPVRVDLIEVTDPTGRFQPPSLDELNAFRDALSRHVRQPIVRRYSGGKDIHAACGTLAGGMIGEPHQPGMSLSRLNPPVTVDGRAPAGPDHGAGRRPAPGVPSGRDAGAPAP